jgi:hypothetical protein
LEPRRAVPLLVAAVVVGGLVYATVSNRDAKPVPLPPAERGGAPDQAVDIYSTSGKNRRLTEQAATESGLPAGHPAIGEATPSEAGTPSPPTTAAKPPVKVPVDADPSTAPVAYEAPAAWTARPPATSMRIAQWALAPEAGSAEGEVYLSVASGDVAANVARWAKQMGKEEAATRTLDVAGMKVTRVDVSGTFTGMAGPGQPAAAPREGWRLLGAVVETPSGTLLFVKGTGPAAVMAREEGAFDAFLASMRPK